MKNKISRCPFCKGRTHIQKSVYDYEEWGGITHAYFIECRDCGARGPYTFIGDYKQLDGESYDEFHNRVKRDCIKIWNDHVARFGVKVKTVKYEDSSLSNGAEAATDKQMKFATVI